MQSHLRQLLSPVKDTVHYPSKELISLFFWTDVLAPGDIRNRASDRDHSTGSLIKRSSNLITEQFIGLLSNKRVIFSLMYLVILFRET